MTSLAVGTELLLGQIVDTNSAWIGEQLAAHGIDSLLQVKVGDNRRPHRGQLRRLLADADAVIVCGGLGPTHDDLTREAIAAVMGVELALRRRRRRRDPRDVRLAAAGGWPTTTCARRMVPVGATVIPQTRGTAPGLICPVGSTVSTRSSTPCPGVPHEMQRDVGAGGPARPASPRRATRR